MSRTGISSAALETEAAIPIMLPLASMIRALCQAAISGPDLVYDVMLMLTLMVDSAAQTYGLATWTQKFGEKPRLKWVEGLDEEEIAEAGQIVSEALAASSDGARDASAGDFSICLVLSATSANVHGSAIYGRCAKPLNNRQAREIRIISDVARLAHVHVALRSGTTGYVAKQAIENSVPSSLPGMVFSSRAMHKLARAVFHVLVQQQPFDPQKVFG